MASFQSGLDQRERALLELERDESARTLGASSDPDRVLNTAHEALARGERLSRRTLSVLPSAVAIACHEGCHWCCHLKVSVTAPEVFWIAAYLRSDAPPSQLSAARTRAAELAQDPRIFSADAKAEAHIPCALLTDQGACGVHGVRPLTCRGYTSTDAEVCRRMLDDDSELVTMHDGLARDLAAMSLGLTAGLCEAGLPAELLELTSALHIALSVPDALPRWVAGEPVFAAARSEQSLAPRQPADDSA